MNRTSNHNINSIMLYHWAIKALIIIRSLNYADKGIAPISTDHEPVMFLLHQPAFKEII